MTVLSDPARSPRRAGDGRADAASAAPMRSSSHGAAPPSWSTIRASIRAATMPAIRSAADAVVAEIAGAGGRAVADYGSVADPAAAAAMVRRAVEAFGGARYRGQQCRQQPAQHLCRHHARGFSQRPRRASHRHVPGDAGGMAGARGAALWPHRVHHQPGRLLRQGRQRRLWRRQDGPGRPDARPAALGRAARHQGELHLAVRADAPRRHLSEGHRAYIDPAQVAAAVALLSERGLSGLGRDRDRRRRAFRDRAHARKPRHRHRQSGRACRPRRSRRAGTRSRTCAIRCSIRMRSRRSARRSRA